MKTPRGIRNNNPGNIDYRKANAWQGRLPRDLDIEPRFERFSAPEYGIRAILKLLSNYRRTYGDDTVRKLISRWAPPGENDTGAYVASVARSCNVGADQALPLPLPSDVLLGLAKAIVRHENGQDPYTDATYKAALALL